jgi:hypothetical protein
MPTYARRLLWSALTGICGEGLFLLGFILPYATLSTGQQRWFLTVTWGTLLTTLQQGDYSVLFWAVLIMGPCALYLGILLDAGRVTRRRHLWVASTIVITGLTFVAGSLLLILDVFILFYNAPPVHFRPSVPPISYSFTFGFPVLGEWLSFLASLALLLSLLRAPPPSRATVLQ